MGKKILYFINSALCKFNMDQECEVTLDEYQRDYFITAKLYINGYRPDI